MKKIIAIVVVIILIALGVFFFFGSGGQKVSDFFDSNDFGAFFDIDPQSKNDFIPPTATTTDQITQATNYVAPALRQISFEPVSGYTYFSTTSTSTRVSINPEGVELFEEFVATSTVIRFQERATGHMYDVFEFLPTPQKISNITIQKIYKTIFTNNRNEFLFKGLSANFEQVRTAFGKIIPAKEETPTASSTIQSVDQKDISSVVNDFTYLTDTNQIIYSVKKTTGSEIYLSDISRTVEKLVTTIPFNEFTIEPLNRTQVVITTKASANAVGYAYTLNITNGALTKIIGNIAGLLIKSSPDLKYYLYSESSQSRPILRAYDTVNNTTRRVGIDTIPEKCIFAETNTEELYCFGSVQYQAALYPNDWYMGKVSNSDNLYKLNLATGGIETIYSFTEDDGSFDVIQPTLTPSNILIFQNKKDLTLWALNLNTLNNQF